MDTPTPVSNNPIAHAAVVEDRLAVLERDLALIREMMPTRSDIAWGVFWGLLSFALLPVLVLMVGALLFGLGIG